MNSKTHIFIIVLLQVWAFNTFAQTSNYYYTKSTTYLSEDTLKKITGINYTDAYGRPLQSILLSASPSNKDIIQTYQYDALGRIIKSYLPFTSDESQNGEFEENALILQQDFYNSDFPNQNAFSQVEYDNSPYNQIIKQSSPGEDINTVNLSSDFEPAGEIDYRTVNDKNQLVNDGTYPPNSLMKYTLKDADDKQTYIYKDKSGKVILKEKANTKTRYVYDKYGQLRYVLSPEGVSRMTEKEYDKNSDLVKKYCYYYEYNEKHQLVTKQLPGKEPVYLRYDDKYRLRLTQDGNMRQDSLWMFINYDPLGRIISTGSAEIEDTDNIPDTISPLPVNGISSFFTGQFYDNYDFIEDQNLLFDTTQAYHEKFDRIRGKPTGSKVRVMTDETEIWLTSVTYYDKYGRTIQTISKNNVGGYDIVSNKYDFSGKLLISKQKHTDYTPNTKFLVYLYNYDTMGRLLKIRLSQSEDTTGAIIINEMIYNELGQVKQKKIHSENGTDFLQTEDFGYNIKGALTNINNPDSLGNDLFGMNLFYDTPPKGFNNTTYNDGKISALQWNSKNLKQTKTYTYEYDELNRLTRAVYTPENRYDVDIQYDLNGNITRLERKGQIISFVKSINGKPIKAIQYDYIDKLTYTYEGNRLTNVQDAAGEVNTQLNNDFHNLTIRADEYEYDANGNMTEDCNKGIDNITYNLLNQPVEINLGTRKTLYTYTATGMKLQTRTYENGNLKNTSEYSGAFVYENNKLTYINIPGGRIVAQTNDYQYHLTDHLGNVRVTFGKAKNGNTEIIQEDHYYPFGMRMNGLYCENTNLLNKYLYNGKEQQEQTLYYDYGFRQYDAQLGRWHVVDAMAEYYFSESPYAYVQNNPINYRDYWGLLKNPGGVFSDDVWAMIDWVWNQAKTIDDGTVTYSGEEAAQGAHVGGHWESRKTFSPKLGGWGRNSAGHLSIGAKIKRFSNPNNWTFWDTKSVWVWDDITFDKLWDNYPSSSIKHIDPKTGKDIFGEHCAINVSEALERSGVDLSSFNGTKCWNCSGSGNHIIRAQELADDISRAIKPVKLRGDNYERYVKGKTGIIFFQDYWKRKNEIGRSGDHIDLWNKNELASIGFFLTLIRGWFPEISESYLNMSDLRRSKSVWFWEIK